MIPGFQFRLKILAKNDFCLPKRKGETFFPDSAIMAGVNTRKESLHASKHNIAKSAVGRTSKRLLDEVFVSLGKVKRRAAEALFPSLPVE